MTRPDWHSAEEALFERSVTAIRQFAAEHSGELFSAFAFTVDSEYAGVALNFDTLENSLTQSRRHERYQIERLNELFALDHGWQAARYDVAHHTNRIVDWNLTGEYKYELVTFVELPAWEDYYNSDEEAPELEGRIIVSLWRVADRLVSSGVFDGLRQSSPFRIAFGFHDGEMIVLRLLNWPEPDG